MINKYKFSRRKLLKGAATLGAASTTAPLLSTQTWAAPKRGGILRAAMGHGSTSDSYDPATLDNAYTQVLATAIHGYLTEIAPDGSLVGEVAQSWDVTPDARIWTFNIRKDLQHHSGKTVTADDVIASLNYHRGDESNSAAKPIVAPIVSMKKNNPHSVTITLNAGNADFATILSEYHLPILPSKNGKIDPKSADGCGAYVLESYNPGVVAKLKRNPNYWKSNRAFFDGVELLSITDSAARLNAILTDEVDVIDRVDLKTVHLLKRAKSMNVLEASGTQHYTFAMDTRVAPFSDNNVRQALKYAIDRQELVDKILNGYGQIGNDHPIGRSNRYHAAEIEQHSYNPDKAKFYLKKSGLNKLKVSLSAADAAYAGAIDAAVLYAEKAAAAGIEINVVREPNDGYWSNVWMRKPWSASYWGGRPTEDWMFSSGYAKGVPWNDTFWDHKRFNQLLKEARSELNDDKRRQLYVEMQNIVSNEGGALVPMFASYVMAYSDKVAQPKKVAANWTMDGLRALERWWFV